MNRCISRPVVLSVLFISSNVVLNSNLPGQSAGYQLPPAEVVDIIDAPPEPAVSFSPDTQWMLMIDRDAMPGIEDVSRRMLQLAGLRIDPAANGRFQTSFDKGLSIRARDSKKTTRVPLPDGAKLSGTSWSHDSKWFAFILVTHQGQQLWIANVENPTKPKMLTDHLNTVMGGFSWMPDGEHLVCRLVPEDHGAEPIANVIPTGPNIQESVGNTSPTRTYQDLLSSPYDEALFEHYATTQLAMIGVNGDVRKIGEASIIAGVSPSPNGRHLLVTTVHRPFSYLMTYRSFPQQIQVWNVQSGTVDYTVAEVPMAENIPIEGVRTGPRNVEWKSVEPATLIWAEALDGGDPNRQAEYRDRIMVCSHPFNGDPVEILKIQQRAFGVEYFADPHRIATTEYDRDRRWIRSLLHDLKTPGTTPIALMDRSIRDRYGDPGRLVSQRNETGHSVIRQDGPWVYRMGRGASKEGDLPFVDRQNLDTLETERLWRCEKGTYESAVAIAASAAEAKPTVITTAETPTTPSNYYLRDLSEDSRVALTDFQDPTPQIRGIKKQLITYERNDGVPLSATLYLPADYKEGVRLPLLVWAYPREFNDAKTAAQISGSPSRFTRMRGTTHLTLLTQGYAIMDAATMPVVGDPETMNDTFVEQIVASAQAAIDKAVEMGVADRDRVGVGGHSYGAFMTANLLAHCDLFKAGVARSGAYNRTLTPFGFQAERRSFWDAKDVYFDISPFMHANRINEPLLLIHGENDNNSGTFPIQSKRMYQAIKGNGGTVRLCMLPDESHGYRARESVLHTQAEMIAWFDTYVAAPGSAAQPYELTFSTFFGGSAGEGIRDVECDRVGNIYVAGTTRSPDFPTTAGAYDEAVDIELGKTRWGYNSDIFVAKFDPMGRLMWSTVIGGPNSEEAYGLEIDGRGHVVVHGRGAVGSPVTTGVFQPEFKGCGGGDPGNPHNTAQNAYVCKLTPDGKTLVWGSFFGIDHLLRDLALDTHDDIYVTWGVRPDANDQSHWDTWMDPTWTANAFQPRPQGGADCGVAKIAADGSRVLWATYLGGSDYDSIEASIDVDNEGYACVGCQTRSRDIPTTPGAHDRTHNGGVDWYVAKLLPDGSDIVYGTFIGDEGDNWLNTHNLVVDDQGNCYSSTCAFSSSFPTTRGAVQRTHAGGKVDWGIVKLSPTGALLAGTLLGGRGSDNPDGIRINSQGELCLFGQTSSPNFPVSRDAYQPTKGTQDDAVMVKLSADLGHLVYGTFLGGKGNDAGRAGCVDNAGSLVVAGSSSGGWPLKNAFQTERQGRGDTVVAKLSTMANR